MSNEENEHHKPQPGTNPEIRYVPVDIRAVEEEDSEIDLVDILKTIWDGRKTIFKTVAVFGILGILIAVFSIEEYSSEVKILPESQRGISLGGLGGLAQQFGFSAAPQQGSEGIPSILYPDLIQSNIFLADLMEYKVPLPDSGNTEVTLKDYFQNHQDTSMIKSLLKYTVFLPFTIKNWLTSEEDQELSKIDKTIADPEKLSRMVQMSGRDWGVVRNLRSRILTERNAETGVVTISVDMQDPVIAAAVADEVVQRLSDYVTENRTEKTRRDVEFIERRFEEAENQFEQAQQRLATFNDANRGQLTAMARTEEQLLQSRYDLAFNLYNSLAERLEEARIKLQEETPVISVLEPAAVSQNPSAPDRMFIVVSLIILGTLIGTTIILIRPFYNRFIREINEQ